jgi:acetyl-CoA carboxylase carboxyl transferase subunit beta
VKLGLFSGRKKYATISVNSIEQKEQPKKSETGKEEKDIDRCQLWDKCPSCNEIIYIKDVKENHEICPKCGHYFKMSARDRIKLLIDEGTFKELDVKVTASNPLNFPGYTEKLRSAKEKSDMTDAVISGTGNMNGIPVSIGAMDFSFMGGSMGAVVGEKLTRVIERGIENKTPVVIVATSGGARMHEGIYSLMQMAKTSAALDRLREVRMPFISIPVNPTTGGITASFAMLGDVIVTEPKALIGFAGPRVIEQTIKQKLPEGFQMSEFLLEHGMVDIIAKREDLKEAVSKIIKNLING